MLPIQIPGNPNLEFRLLETSDLEDLQIFCDHCTSLNLKNNDSFKSIKLDKMSMPYGQYFIGYDHDKKQIWNLAGVHQLPEVGEHAWRCLFRGVQLPGYSMNQGLSRDFFKTGYQFSYVLEMQVRFILQHDPISEFYTSTNNLNNDEYFSKSQNLDQNMLPLLVKRGIFTKAHDDFTLYNTKQSIWKLNFNTYLQERKKSIGF